MGNPIALPEGLQYLAGQLVDVDSHEMMPAQVWVQECGDVAARLQEEWLTNGGDVTTNPNHSNCPGYEEDDAPIDAESIWERKGSLAPGATNLARRAEVMDVMGIGRQLCFPTGVGMWGAFMVMNSTDLEMNPSITEGRVEYGKALCAAYAEWAIKAAREAPRVRIVLPVFGDTVSELMSSVRHLIDNGIRAIWLPSCLLPGGVSPAHSDLDPFWELMTEKDITVCLHVGPDQPYATDKWGKAPVFEGFRLLNEFRVDPFALNSNIVSSRNFLMTMVVGAVFERHPALRFGVIETGGYWVGPLCEQMDMWHENSKTFQTRATYRLPRDPSYYVKRNVRVSCYDFEPVDVYVERYGFEDVLCFATDYPHIEGGKDPAGDWFKRLEPMGSEVVEKFFVRNGQWLLPE